MSKVRQAKIEEDKIEEDIYSDKSLPEEKPPFEPKRRISASFYINEKKKRDVFDEYEFKDMIGLIIILSP